ncbi:MAG: HD domain-containing protein [Chitinophagaceae bacterium]|nr:HD domain-containing protein [Chitinophagaceae bacterium]
MTGRKIINDPVYGFINVDDPIIMEVLKHPYYQRLRRIHQMALAQLVYPGAVHSRLHHSLGAYHLMNNALHILKSKGVDISPEEEQAAKLAILLHDAGHGPYSHTLEGVLVKNKSHEDITLLIMRKMNEQLGGALSRAIRVFSNQCDKKFLHQLVSSQLDVDRMDYLIRDSFFTGVSEGVIGYDRILNMLTVHKGELMVEEKGIHSIEKFLVSRRFMYWQVYLHKTVMCAEKMLVKIIERVREIGAESPSPVLNNFLTGKNDHRLFEELLDDYCHLDDVDIMYSLKVWAHHPDKVLSTLSKGILDRNLLKVQYFPQPVEKDLVKEKRDLAMRYLMVSEPDAHYLAFTGEAKSMTYNPTGEHINILFKNGEVKDISKVDHPLINQSLFGTTKKFYICYLNMNVHVEKINTI